MGDWKGRFWYKEVFPFTAMVAGQCISVGWSTIFKAAALKGLNYHVFMLYCYGIAALLLLPLCYLFHRKSRLPPLTIGLLGRFFFLGFLGFVGQCLGYKGIEYSNPTLASAMTNLTPASTFILAVLFRMENLEMKSLISQVKIIGTVVTIAGALVVVLYNGPVLLSSPTYAASVFAQHPALVNIIIGTEHSDWVKGGALVAAQYLITGFWCIYQAKAARDYPAELVLVFFYNLSCGIIAAPVCLIAVPNSSAWNIFKLDVQLYSVLYAGVFGSGIGILIQTWGLHVKGPVYVASFMPLSIAIAAIMGFIFLGDDLYLGRNWNKTGLIGDFEEDSGWTQGSFLIRVEVKELFKLGKFHFVKRLVVVGLGLLSLEIRINSIKGKGEVTNREELVSTSSFSSLLELWDVLSFTITFPFFVGAPREYKTQEDVFFIVTTSFSFLMHQERETQKNKQLFFFFFVLSSIGKGCLAGFQRIFFMICSPLMEG